MKYPGLIGPAYRSSAYMADRERCINFYLEKNETPNAPSPYCLLPTPGFELLTTVNEGPIRGIISEVDGRCFFVAGFSLYEWDGTTATARGTVAADEFQATLCWNGPGGGELFITSGDAGYIFTLATNTLTTVLASGARMGAFLDGFFLALDATTGTLQISDLLNGLTWDVTQIAQRTAAADPWIAMTVIHREIWLMGGLTSEVWYDSGAFPFPFAPIPGAFIEYGAAASFSANRDVEPLMWVSRNSSGERLIMLAQGYQATRISTHGIENVINGYDDVSLADSLIYQENGHTFYCVTFPDETTWAYDTTEGAWHERAYWNSATSTFEPWRVSCHALAFGDHVVGSRTSGALYRMSSDLYVDVGDVELRRMRQPPRISGDGQRRINIQRVQLVMDVGIGLGGLSTTQGYDPQVMRRASRDGGRTWGPEKWRSAGRIGEYNARVFWQPCGQARNYVDQFVFTDPVAWRITDGEIELTIGTS